MIPRLAFLALLAAAVGAAPQAQDGYPEGVRNTEDPKYVPLPPEEAVLKAKVPEGFTITLFAGEPNVAQPISMNFDERGRLWVGECYSYETSSGPWKSPVRDRILILEDTKGDGRFSSRKVFWNGAKNLTSVLPGFGGVWICSTPNLIFIPDKDRKDAPDGDPVVLLDGWNDGPIGHCVVNGLQWGPDGWLYGTQGIQGESKVGKPGAPDSERVRFNGGIWRYHPTRKVFEVVCEGTTNPWGLDWDDVGQAFFTNCVIGHLWHVIPGAHYERMYGRDFTPNTYGLIKSCSDHVHFSGADWKASKSPKADNDLVGGGHAHAGAMVYLGDNWPEKYRGSIFMSNIHGHRINTDVFERRGSGYVAHHAPDFLRSDDVWFRALQLRYGPDGGVFISDWCDVGECHDVNAVHRTSGRIYKVVHGSAKPVPDLDLVKRSDAELVKLQLHSNEWFVRQARRLLQERAAAGANLKEAHQALREILEKNPDPTRKLRALWALHASEGIDEKSLAALLGHENEHVRSWAVRLLCDHRPPSEEVAGKLAAMAAEERSPLVRLFLASSVKRLAADHRWELASTLARRTEDADDPNIPLMVWYGLEPLVAADTARAAKLATEAGIPLLRRYIAQRIAGTPR